MILGIRGRDLIKSYETLKLSAYLPTKDDVPTIGYGHTRGVKMGDICTIDQAEKWLRDDVSGSEKEVNELIEKWKVKLTQSMFDALVSLVFNVGGGAIKAGKGNQALKQDDIGSTIWRELTGLGKQNKPDYYSACQAFMLWRKQKGKDLLGLARRRAKEMVLFLEDGLP
jgi:lysozyme